MLGFLKKDYNRHHSYNTAVTFFRIALVFLLLTLGAAALRFFYSPPMLKADGTHSYTVNRLDKHTVHHRRSTTTTYHAACTDEEGKSHNQTITKTEYETLKKGQTYECPSYISEGGGYFISFGKITTAARATKEYYSRFPDQHIVARDIVMFILLGLTVLNIAIGLSQLKREKKFIEDTDIIRRGSLPGAR